MMLRPYQQLAIDQLYSWFAAGNAGNPCLVLPTGSGKSHIIAAICEDAVTQWPETRILMLTHVKELIQQNAAKMLAHWPGAPMGIYSAGLGKRQLGEPITFAGIQSVRKRSADIGRVELVIIDECHLCGHTDTGGYRDLLRELTAINPDLRVIGLTATPYRLGHGMITDEPAIFSALLEPVNIFGLISLGFLATLRSKLTKTQLDVSGVRTRGGEYVEGELQAKCNVAEQNERVVAEILTLAGERKSWLLFCCGVDHAFAVCEALKAQGVAAACVTGETPKAERASLLAAFKAGELRALTNANVLTTGFDHPGVDLIAMLRPTLSPGLYVQMCGRGMRPTDGKTDCLVLDFAGVIGMHGPIAAVGPPAKKVKGDGPSPVKVCAQCAELVPPSCRVCPACGFAFPPPPVPPLELGTHDIMGDSTATMEMHVTEWAWAKHIGRTSGIESLRVRYYAGYTETVEEYLAIVHDGYAGEKARRLLARISRDAGVPLGLNHTMTVEEMAAKMAKATPPAVIVYSKRGRFTEIHKREWA